MATQSYNTPIDHTSDAGFRAWGLQLSTALQAAGLVLTSDTGQINWTTVIRPTSVVAAGYEIYRLNDSLNPTFPIFIKIEYGTSNTNAPGIWLTIGQGSNGSGTVTGWTSTRAQIVRQSPPSSTSTNYATNICVTGGFFGFEFKREAVDTVRSYSHFWLCRSCADDASLTGDNVFIGYSSNASTAGSYAQGQILNITAGSVGAVFGGGTNMNTGAYTYIPGNVTASLVSTSPQCYHYYGHTPRLRPVFGCLQVLNSEFANDTVFTTIPVGSTVSRTYKVTNCTYTAAGTAGLSNSWAMLWE